MEINDCVAVVTGGATGIGRALVERFYKEGASGLVVADLDMAGAKEVAKAVKYLCSEEAAYLSGITLNINGGMHFNS